MHRHHVPRAQIDKRPQRLLGIHVDLAPARRVVGPDGQQRHVDRMPRADFPEALEIRRVAAVENRAPADLDDEPAEAAVRIMQHPRAPVMRRRERDFRRSALVALPVMQLMHAAKAEVMHQISHLERHHDRLIRRHPAQRLAVEVVKVRVRHEHEVDRRQVVEPQPRMLHPLENLQPLRPVRIDEQILLARLDEKRGVTRPGDADFTLAEFGEIRRRVPARPRLEDRGDEHLGEKIPLLPAVPRLQPDLARRLVLPMPVGRGGLLDVRLRFAFLKRIGHRPRIVALAPGEAKFSSACQRRPSPV